MTPEEKAKKAGRLFELTALDSLPPLPREEATGKVRELQQQLADRYRTLQIELRIKHFTDEQLEALLNFYESELGQSILEAELSMKDEFRVLMKGITNELNAGASSGMAEIVVKRKNGDTDT